VLHQVEKKRSNRRRGKKMASIKRSTEVRLRRSIVLIPNWRKREGQRYDSLSQKKYSKFAIGLGENAHVSRAWEKKCGGEEKGETLNPLFNVARGGGRQPIVHGDLLSNEGSLDDPGKKRKWVVNVAGKKKKKKKNMNMSRRGAGGDWAPSKLAAPVEEREKKQWQLSRRCRRKKKRHGYGMLLHEKGRKKKGGGRGGNSLPRRKRGAIGGGGKKEKGKRLARRAYGKKGGSQLFPKG